MRLGGIRDILARREIMRPRAHTMVYQGMPQLVIIKRSEEPLHGVHYNAVTSMGRVVSQRLPPLSSLSIAVVQSAQSDTSLFSSRLSGPVSLLADMFIHPAALITSGSLVLLIGIDSRRSTSVERLSRVRA